MSLLTLFRSERGFVATDRLVFAPEELDGVQSSAELAAHLDGLLTRESDRIDQATEQARAAGEAAGREQGLAAAAKEVADQLQGFDQKHRKAVDDMRAETTSLALEIVRRIAADVAPADWLAAQAARASEELLEHAPLVLRVHPDQASSVRDALQAKSSAFDDVVADDTLAIDACTIESRVGRVDASLSSQLQRLGELDLGPDGSSA